MRSPAGNRGETRGEGKCRDLHERSGADASELRRSWPSRWRRCCPPARRRQHRRRQDCDARANNTYPKILECIRLDQVRAHQAALQEIADENDGNRFSGFSGYDASVDYVVETLEAAGYDPEVQEFDYLAFEVVGPSALQQTAPNAVTYVEGVDFGAITQTDPGDVTAAVTAVDLQLGLGNTSTSGCEASDFAGFPAGNIALIQRGGSYLFDLFKAYNAQAAGASSYDHVQSGQ